MGHACSIFFFEGYIGVSPTVLNLVKALDRADHVVTVYGSRNPFPQPQSAGAKTRLRYLRRMQDFPLGNQAIHALRRLRLASAIPGIELAMFALQCVARMVTSQRRREMANPSIGVDTNGAIVAFLWHKLTGSQYVYLSLELRNPRHARLLSAFINSLERAAYRSAAAVVIQDGDRYRTLNTYLEFDHPRVLYLPNTPSGSDDAPRPTGFNFFRQRLGIAESAYPIIVLQAGMIDSAVFSEEVARSFASIQRDWALVFHERLQRSFTDPFLVGLLQSNRTNLFLSLDPVALERVDDVFASATIGLALYRDVDSNFGQISMASGKLGYYLKHGKPVVVSGSQSLSTFVERTGVGRVVDDPANPRELQRAIDELLRDYEEFSRRARACFLTELDFDRNVAPVVETMIGIAKPVVDPR